ncbi:hypothetical protein N9535_03220 [Amylibacter sp.]|nr:hypothetical protein [Amylibacter sp.]MDB4095666.1 hypothetical protein [Amylibacter sp.]
MIKIQHRVNSKAQLQSTNINYGIEIDIRNHGKDLLVIHDPFSSDAVNLSEWLSAYNHNFLIVNVKEEGLEPQILSLLAKNNITNFFILDESIPYIRKYALKGISNFALRVSEFESVETAIALNIHLKKYGKCIDWIWMDTFTGIAMPLSSIKKLQVSGFKLCQVSPELHHIDDPESWERRISTFQNKNNLKIIPDMVCTKRPDLW